MKKAMLIFGTRPEAIKMAPVIFELKKHKNKLKTTIVCTAQHKEMLDQVLDIFDIKPDYCLNIMTKNQTLADITSSILEKLSKIIFREKPDIIVVQGDTTTAFASALCAYYHKIGVAHIEAGLRTRDKYSPYPEELNRVMIDSISDLHFAPTEKSKENLKNESVNRKSIFVTGNTVVDALFRALNMKFSFLNDKLKKVNFRKRIILVTAHRRESWGKAIADICRAVGLIAKENDDIEIVFSYHLNPVVRKSVEKLLGNAKRVHLVPPLSYCDMANIIKRSYLVITDSGGIQEEAPYLSKPVLIIRNLTERPEVVEKGVAKIVGVKKENIVKQTQILLDSRIAYKKMAKKVQLYGKGRASHEIVKKIKKYLHI